MSRLAIVGIGVWVLGMGFAAEAVAQTENPVVSQMPGVDVADLKEQLESGLKARLPSEFQFIAQVVQMVDQGTLPVALVKSTFQWARRKSNFHPFRYFEPALRIRAARLGIQIP